MNSELSERLRGFQVPAVTALPSGRLVVARLQGVDFEGVFNSPDYAYDSPLDARFGKIMVRTSSLLLGGDACGRYASSELTEFSVLLDHDAATSRWEDATDLQNYLVGLASTKMSRLLDADVLFICKLYAFSSADLVLAYFTWRQQELSMAALDAYCGHVLMTSGGNTPEQVASLLSGLGPKEKEEILRQNQVEFEDVPAWQRYGVGVHLDEDAVVVDTSLPRDEQYRAYVQRFL